MPENPDRGSEAVNLAAALRAQAELSRDPAVAESLRRSAARMEEADARLRDGLASLEQAITNAKTVADERGSENALPRWVVVVLTLAVVFVLGLGVAVRGGP
jgi:hypothetical protein